MGCSCAFRQNILINGRILSPKIHWLYVPVPNWLGIPAVFRMIIFCSAFGFDEDSIEYKKYYSNFSACSEYLDNIGFYEWMSLPDGTDAKSDYGLTPLKKLIMELEECNKPEEKNSCNQ